MTTDCRLGLWFGLLTSLGALHCGGRSVLNDERAYGDGRVEGVEGREIFPWGSVTFDGTNTTLPTTIRPNTGTATSPTGTATLPTGVKPTGVPTAPTSTTGTTGTPVPTTTGTATMPVPTTIPVNPTSTVAPTTGTSPTTTVTVPTGMPTTAPTSTATTAPTSTATTAPTTGTTGTTSEALPALVPFPPAGFEPNLPTGFDVVDWQDPFACSHNVYNGRFNCSVDYWCADSGDTGSAYCYLSGDQWYCDCSSGQSYASVQIANGAILEGEACRIAGALCISDWPEQQAGECYETNDRTREYCSYGRYCDQPLSSDEAHVKKTVQEYSNCSYSKVNADEFVSCGCSNGALGEFSVPWDPATACTSAYAACESGVDEGSLGEVECAWLSSSSEPTYCSTADRCVRQATAGGVPIGVVAHRQTSCYLNAAGDDAWNCTCDYDGATRRYTADSARDACDIAIVDCQGL